MSDAEPRARRFAAVQRARSAAPYVVPSEFKVKTNSPAELIVAFGGWVLALIWGLQLNHPQETKKPALGTSDAFRRWLTKKPNQSLDKIGLPDDQRLADRKSVVRLQ